VPIKNGLIKPLPRSQVPHWFGQHCGGAKLVVKPVPILEKVYVHQRIADQLEAVLTAIADAGKSSLVDRSDYGGTYNCRQTRRGGSWSPHAWAIAIDLNVHHFADGSGGDEKRGRTNYRCKPADIAPSLHSLAPFFNAWGFAWGGDWSSFKDPMHYEATELTVKVLEGGLSDAEVAIIDKARAAIGQPASSEQADISPWAQEAVDWVLAERLMTVFDDGLFHGKEFVTREQVAIMLKRLKEYMWNLFYQ